MSLDREQIANWDAAPRCWRIEDDDLVIEASGKKVSVPHRQFGDLVLALVQAMQRR